MAAALVVATFLVAVWAGLQALGGAPFAAPERPFPDARGAIPVVHVVQQGETVWAIARRIHPRGDPRPVVDRLVAANHGTTLRVGEELVLAGS